MHRIFVYKSQTEDANKALRKKGYTPRLFGFNKPAWENEEKERRSLKLEVENANNQLKKSAVASF